MERRFVFATAVVFVYVFYVTFNDTQSIGSFTRHLIGPTQSAKVHVAGRRRNDGAWYNFSVPPKLLFYAYSSFVDVRAAPVVRVIGISTSTEEQRERNVTLFCVCHYADGRPTTVSHLLDEPSPIGAGYPLYGITLTEYVYPCPLMYNDTWPVSVAISTEPGRHQLPAMPVEIPVVTDNVKPLGVCVPVTFGKVDPVRLVEWFEFQRLLGVSFVGVYLATGVSRAAERVFRYYADVDGLVDLWRTKYIGRIPGGTRTTHEQNILHCSAAINDCMYRNMFRFSRIAVIDFDEVIVPRRHWTRLIEMVDELHRNYSAAAYVFRNNYFFTDLPTAPNETSNVTFVRHREKTALSGPGYSIKCIIDPKTCVNMHNHYCWGFINNTLRHHDIEPDVAVVQHYKRCHFRRSECRQMMNVTFSDDTVLKYRAQLTTVVPQKLASVMQNHVVVMRT